MYRQHLRRPIARLVSAAVAAVTLAVGSAPVADAEGPASRRDADLLKQKVATINVRGATPARQVRRTTIVTENEVNAYLALDAHKDLPAGVIEPSVAILGPGRLSARAVVDLDAVRRQSPPTSLLDPRNLLFGRLPVTASGVLTTSNGIARLSLESVAVGGIPMPKAVLQEILSYYSRTPEKPGGISLDDGFPLPANIREIQVDRGQAIVVQ